MSQENIKYDRMAIFMYTLHRRDRDSWPTWHHLKRNDRDFWRAQAQIAEEDESWPEPEGDFL